MGVLLLCEVTAVPFYERTGAEFNSQYSMPTRAAAPCTHDEGPRAHAVGGVAGHEAQPDPAGLAPCLNLRYNEVCVFAGACVGGIRLIICGAVHYLCHADPVEVSA